MPKSVDRNCDVNVAEFANVYSAAVNAVGIATVSVASDVPRAICDLNRARTCAFKSRLWTRLVAVAAGHDNVRIIEVHSFETADDFDVDESTYSVVLALHNNDDFEERIARATGSTLLRGSKEINALGALAQARGWHHVLLETRYDTPPEVLQRIAQGIAQVVQE